MAETDCMVFMILCFGLIDGNSVSLTPSPVAYIKEGETLHLQCVYSGLYDPYFINWYLNGDKMGLVIDASKCTYQTLPEVYELNRLQPTCNRFNFTLSVSNISKAKDNGSKWECDNTIFGMMPPSKASTTIRVIEEETSCCGGKGSEGLISVVIIGIIVGVLICVPVLIGAVCYIIKMRQNVNSKSLAHIEAVETVLKVQAQMYPENVPGTLEDLNKENRQSLI